MHVVIELIVGIIKMMDSPYFRIWTIWEDLIWDTESKCGLWKWRFREILTQCSFFSLVLCIYIIFQITFIIRLCVCMWVWVCECVYNFLESLFFFHHVYGGSNSGHQAWQQAPLPTEASHWLIHCFLLYRLIWTPLRQRHHHQQKDFA